jgi:ABC-type dipeptide/oligopeptide/nickel transport system permease subunit
MNEGTKPAVVATPAQSLRGWLLAEEPSSRRQIAWGERYRTWRRFAANRLALGALIAVALLILIAIAAPLLAPDNPYAQNLAARLSHPPRSTGSAPTNSAGTCSPA